MRILFIHVFYTVRGGEDSVFEQELKLVKSSNFEVESVSLFNSHGFRGIFDFIMSISNPFAWRKIYRRIKIFKPDIVHFHNIHFAIGPLVLRKLSKLGFPIVMTLHNYRLICPSATLFNKGTIFLDSMYSRFHWSAILNRVYKNSVLLTFWLTFVNYYHRQIGSWDKVDRYIVLTPFAKSLFANSSFSLKKEKMVIKPNFVERPIAYLKRRSSSFLFIGRLSEEKGIDLLLDAFILSGYPIRIGGDGPLREKVLNISRSYPNILFLGRLSLEEVKTEMESCTALIFPSIWFEGMPMTIIEAFSLSTPVIANKLGAMESMIEDGVNGLHFSQTVDDLISKTSYWNSLTENDRINFGKEALTSYEKIYTPEKNLQMLLSIYESILDERKKKSN
ncbi:glycosyltransferase [Algoriphagus vanfongensis]|uniref:glycosyltransferase n=1 Tax=Algoriphagus vanfongensis TaxID=426371 RepID=UPI00040A8055|nr:glycosyltransferase [Algoriphagus vanfongensis]